MHTSRDQSSLLPILKLCEEEEVGGFFVFCCAKGFAQETDLCMQGTRNTGDVVILESCERLLSIVHIEVMCSPIFRVLPLMQDGIHSAVMRYLHLCPWERAWEHPRQYEQAFERPRVLHV